MNLIHFFLSLTASEGARNQSSPKPNRLTVPCRSAESSRDECKINLSERLNNPFPLPFPPPLRSNRRRRRRRPAARASSVPIRRGGASPPPRANLPRRPPPPPPPQRWAPWSRSTGESPLRFARALETLTLAGGGWWDVPPPSPAFRRWPRPIVPADDDDDAGWWGWRRAPSTTTSRWRATTSPRPPAGTTGGWLSSSSTRSPGDWVCFLKILWGENFCVREFVYLGLGWRRGFSSVGRIVRGEWS